MDLSNAGLGRILGNISGQLIGMYLSGERKPKIDFYDKWEKAFGYRVETNVSREKNEDTVTHIRLLTDVVNAKDALIEQLRKDVKSAEAKVLELESRLKGAKKARPR